MTKLDWMLSKTKLDSMSSKDKIGYNDIRKTEFNSMSSEGQNLIQCHLNYKI